MKKLITSLLKPCNSILLFLLLLFFNFSGLAENPVLSNHLVNLSAGVNPEALNDIRPEMAVVGNTVHTAWIEYKYGTQQWLYYRRSTDLGKTWETPKPVLRLSSWDRENTAFPGSNFLAVDGNHVHIAIDDFNYNEMKRFISYVKSTDGGASFGTPQELEVVTGFNDTYRGSCIKAANGKVAIAYGGPSVDTGIFLLFSGNGGNSFTKKTVSKDYIYLSDFFYDGSQMIVLGDIRDVYLSYGRVYASVSNNDGDTFTTSKISRSHKDSGQNDVEQSITHHQYRNSKKIAKSGNSIHIVFSGVENGAWTTFYVRSANNGATFEGARDINQGILPSALLQNYMETVAAKNDRVYIAYLSKQGKPYFLASGDNGSTFSEPRFILSENFSHVETTSWPNLALDPTDNSGKTFYLTGYNFFSVKSADGGLTFFNSSVAAPFLLGDFSNGHSRMVVDNSGNKHWIGEVQFRKGTDKDVFYRIIGPQPEPGNTNKSCLIETVVNDKAETLIVPSTPALNFGQAMTAEAWVKIDPSTEGKINILGKINGYDGDDLYPFFNEVSGYFMGFLKSGNKFALHTRLVTDKGKFLNIGDYTLDDNLWHHIAITYDAGAGTNNFKTYFDGLLVKEQTVTGDILQGDGLLMIGSRLSYSNTSKYEVDDIRLWNRALSQEELLFNQVNKLNGKEEGLKLFLNFDDTYKDISDNGHDALPVYQGILKNSDFDPPVPDFDLYKTNNQVSLTNKTKNGADYRWIFGDGATSGKANPVYTYPTPGEYFISLTARNTNSVTTAMKGVSISGLSHIEPISAGNQGSTYISVFGGGLSAEGTTFLLRKTGSSDITGNFLYSPAQGVLSAQFHLKEASLGKWDVVIKKGDSELLLQEAFQIVEAKEPDPWVTIIGRSSIMFNRWQTYTISFGNNGNSDALGVPVWFAITDDPGLEVEFIDFEMKAPYLAEKIGIVDEIKDLGPYFVSEKVLGETMNARVYPFMIPVIKANSSSSIHIRVKTPRSIQMTVWNNPPWIESISETGESILKSCSSINEPTNAQILWCLGSVLTEAVFLVGSAVYTPFFSCYASAAMVGFQIGMAPSWKTKQFVYNTLWNIMVTGIDCALALSGLSGLYKAAGVLTANLWDYIEHLKSCRKFGYADNVLSTLILAVDSFDPNEITGPAGFGAQRWIQKNNNIPYTIMFENKNEATAPAHDVFITDTLDLSVFDISDFGFGPFGWGDTIFSPPGIKMKQFSMDFDLRPGLELITRVSGKLDTLTGIVNWEFLSLNPGTMDLEEDPFLGFLPPNVTSPEGEGFVSYSVGLKEGLGTGDEIRNKASIVFDANEPIITNEYLNTLDLDTPQSQVYPLEATTDSRFTLDWTGSDEGSGIKGYTVYVMVNDTALVPWMINTNETSATYEGEVGSSYKFYSIATDNVSLVENAPDGYDAQTTVTVNVEEFERVKSDLTVWPNPAADNLRVTLQHAPCGMYVVELVNATGAAKHSQLYTDLELHNGVNLNVREYTPGNYIVRIIFGNRTETRNIIIR